MAILPTPILDYTDKDFDSLRARLFTLIASVFPEWTDQNVANFGNILIELFAHVGDVLTFYQDGQARESRWSTATRRASLLALAKLIGFEAETAAAATVDVQITVRDAGTGGSPIDNVTIPAGTFVSTAAIATPARLQLLSDALVSAGADPPTVTVSAENSEAESNAFSSNDQPDQTIVLPAVPYIDGSATITAADGTYTEVDNFLDSDSGDRHFTVVVDNNDRATVRFGNGVNGRIPSGTITVSYKTGGGVDANSIGPGEIKVIDGSFFDDSGNPVVVTVTNAASPSNGQDRQNAAQIREAAPKSIRVLNRAVAREDFDIVAEGVAGVARALMLTSDQDPSVAENTGNLYIVPEGGGAPSQALKDLVEAEFDEMDGDYPHTLTFSLNVLDAVYLTINVSARVYFAAGVNTTAAIAEAAALIRSNVADFFQVRNDDGTLNEKIGFGYDFKDANGDPAGEIALSDVHNVVRDTTGVRKIGDTLSDFQLNGEHRDVTISAREFPVLGTVTLINGDTGLPI